MTRMLLIVIILCNTLFGGIQTRAPQTSAPTNKVYPVEERELFAAPGSPASISQLRETNGVLVDSSKNGYGMLISEVNPISISNTDPNNIVMVYRQFLGTFQTSGSIGAAYSEDGGLSFETYSNMNTGLSVAGGRYPSVVATPDYPVFAWTESGGGGGGDYGGRAVYSIGLGGYDQGQFSTPADIHSNPSANDAWIPIPTHNMDGQGNHYFNFKIADWSNTRNHVLFHSAETAGWAGTNLNLSSGITLLDVPADFLWDGASNYVGNGNLDINDDGTGYFVTSAYWGDDILISNHTLFIKKTTDFGATWSDWYFLPDEMMDAYFEDVFPEGVYDEETDTWIYLGGEPGGAWSPFVGYDIEVITDSDGRVHVWAGVLPSWSSSVFTSYSEECGIYHFSASEDAFAGGGGPIAMQISPVGSMQLGWMLQQPGWSSNVISAAYDVMLEDALYVVYFTASDTVSTSAGDLNIYVNLMGSYSLDNGASWTPPLNLTMTDDPLIDEIDPHINRVARNGRIQILYQIPDYNIPTIDPPDVAEDYLCRLYFWEYDFGITPEIDSTATLLVGTTSGTPGQTVIVPVSIELPPDSTMSSFELDLMGFYPQLALLEIDASPGLIDILGWSYEYAIDETGVLSFAAAGANDISGSGLLFNLILSISEDAPTGFVPIDIDYAMIEDGNMLVDMVGGGVQIQFPIDYGDVDLNGYISAYDAAQILKHLVGYITLGPEQQANADVSLDGTVSGLDASLILQYMVHIIDELPFVPGEVLLAGSGHLSFAEPLMLNAENYDVPLVIEDSENLLSLAIDLEYDPEILALAPPELPESLSAFTLEIREDETGSKLVLVATVPVNLDQETIILPFQVQGVAGEGQRQIAVRSSRFNEAGTQADVALVTLVDPSAINTSVLPQRMTLLQNYPNPFNPSTTIQYALPAEAGVTLRIFDIGGAQVFSSEEKMTTAGWHSFTWVPEGVGAGIYFCELQADGVTSVIKLTYLR